MACGLLLEKMINCWRRSWRELIQRSAYYQWRNKQSYESRIKTANAVTDST